MSMDVRVMWMRGETEFLDLTPFITQGRWTRKLDTWDDAQVSFGPVSASCCEQLMGIRPWLHELWIRQDGETQFIGPITHSAPGTTGQIDAAGLAAWFDVRFVRNFLDTTGAPVPTSAVLQFIIDSALSASDPNMVNFITVDQCDVPMERVIDPTGATTGQGASGPPIAWRGHMIDIIGTYMHMSSYGRQLRFWCAKTPCYQELAQLGIGDLVSDAPISFDGDTFATRAAVYNDKSGADAIVGYAGGINSYGVLVERKFQDKNVTSDATAQDGASTHARDLPALVAGQQEGDAASLSLHNCSGADVARMQVGSCMMSSFGNACAGLTAFMRLEEITGTWDSRGELTTIRLSEPKLTI